MTESKRSEAEDRLSELPDSLIFHIFSFLHNTRDVVRTTILSHRWKNLWTTIPYLTFNDYQTDDSADKVRNFITEAIFINEALKLWRGFRILKFRVSLHPKIEKSIISDIDSWVRFATENGVEDLNLGLLYRQTEEVMYWAPQYLYSCSSLKVLSLEGCNIQIEQNVQWNHLKSLTIYNDWISEHVVNQILSGCPQLEDLGLFFTENDDNLSIRSSSLKWLAIEKWPCDYSEQSKDSELRIWTSNLEKLNMFGAPYSKCLLMNVSSLTRVKLGFYGPIRYLDYSCPWNDFLGESLMQIFPTIQHVGKVTLSDWCIEVLGTVEKKYLLSPLLNVKFLQLNGCFLEYGQTVRILEMFPKMEMLVLQAEEEVSYPVLPESYLKFEINLSESFLLQLRTVEVRWTKGDTSFFGLIEFLLKYASQLERVVFRKRKDETTFDVEVLSFCITGNADEKTEILNQMQS